MGNIIVFIIIAKQIISALICHHLIRTYDVRVFPLGVQLEVLAIAVINEADFPPLLDGIVQHIQIQQNLLVVRVYEFRQMGNMLHFGMEVFVSKPYQLLNQPFGLCAGKRAGEEDAVDQHPQFRILKLARHKADAALQRNLIPHILKEHKIVLDRLPSASNTIVCSQQIHDFLLRQAVVAVRMLLQKLQEPHVQKLLVLQSIGIHTLTSSHLTHIQM